MNSKEQLQRYMKWTLYMSALSVLGFGLTPYSSVFAGAILGMGTSLFNIWLLARRAKLLEERMLQGLPIKALGMSARFAAAISAILIALRFPEAFHMLGVLVGLFLTYMFIVIDLLIHALNRRGKEVSNSERRRSTAG